tara:strand:+ start:131942 stop:132778 length:837 start_codon:yes stop_codon:yes gene_type:complete
MKILLLILVACLAFCVSIDLISIYDLIDFISTIIFLIITLVSNAEGQLIIVGLIGFVMLGLIFSYSIRSFKSIGSKNDVSHRWDVGYSGHSNNSGEAKVRRALTQYCRSRNAHVLNNVTLRLEDGSTTQVDHILVSTKGIFVIETKHYSGWIFADPKSKAWAQTFFRIKFRFQNPIFQNYKHVKATQKLLAFIEPRLIHNVVVFTGDALFKTDKPDNVFYIEELIPAIEQYTDAALSLNRVQFCIGRLEYMRLELTRETDIEHHEYLTQKFGRLPPAA